jgi:hypothetical protein
MVSKEFCHTCKQKTGCQQVYRQLGDAEGPPVGAKVCLAFLVPLVVFIVSLGICERILNGQIKNVHILSVISLLLALLVTFTCILITRVVRRQPD